MKSKEELKSFFENGDTPKQDQFWEWQDSYWHKDEKLPLENVDYDFSNKADLVDGKIPTTQLPSYVDDILEFDSINDLPNPGEGGKIYIVTSTNTQLRWSGSEYIKIISGENVMITDSPQDVFPEGKKTFWTDNDNNSLHIKNTNSEGAGITFDSNGVGQIRYNDNQFHFTNNDGTNSIPVVSEGFKKEGSNNEFYLTGGGDHVHNLIKEDAWYHSHRDFPNGTLIETDVDYSQDYGDQFLLEIKGNMYDNSMPLDAKIQGYIYLNGTNPLLNLAGYTTCYYWKSITALNRNGKLCFWFPRLSYWQGFDVKLTVGYGGIGQGKNRVISVIDSPDPIGTKRVDIYLKTLATQEFVSSQPFSTITSAQINNWDNSHAKTIVDFNKTSSRNGDTYTVNKQDGSTISHTFYGAGIVDTRIQDNGLDSDGSSTYIPNSSNPNLDYKVTPLFHDGSRGWQSSLLLKGWGNNYKAWKITGDANADDVERDVYISSSKSSDGTWLPERKIWTEKNFNPDSKTNALENATAIGFQSGLSTGFPYFYHNTDGYIPLATQSWVDTQLNDHVTLDTTQNINSDKTLGKGKTLFSGWNEIAVPNPEMGAFSLLNLALQASQPLYDDTEFREGYNGCVVYNNEGNGSVTIERITDNSSPTGSNYVLKVKHDSSVGTSSPGLGGVIQGYFHRSNAIFIQKIIAKIPVGYSIGNAENTLGLNSDTGWLTSQEGTGKWETYVRVAFCGNTGDFANGGHLYLNGSNPDVEWRIASINSYDINGSLYETIKQKYWKKFDDGTYKGLSSDKPFSLVNETGTATQKILTGGLLTSDIYADAANIPTNGIYSKGNHKALGFVKTGSDDNYFLTGGGSHLPVSSKANAMENATGIGFSSGNIPTVDGTEFPYIYHSPSGFVPLATQDFANFNFHKINNAGGINNGSTTANRTWFDYNWAGEGFPGSVINFSGLGGDYSTELFADYISNTKIGVRTHNGDSANIWNPVRWLWHDGNFNPNDYVPISGDLNVWGIKSFTGPYTQWTLDGDGTTNARGFIQSDSTSFNIGTLNNKNFTIYRNGSVKFTVADGQTTFLHNVVVPNAVDNNHAINLRQLNNIVGNYLPLAGGTLTGGGFIQDNGNIVLQQTGIGGNATGLFWYKMDDSERSSGIGTFTQDGEVQYIYMGWSNAPWDPYTSLSISDSFLKYKNNSIFHAGETINYSDSLTNIITAGGSSWGWRKLLSRGWNPTYGFFSEINVPSSVSTSASFILSENGNGYLGGNTIWTSGNFEPSDYIPYTGANQNINLNTKKLLNIGTTSDYTTESIQAAGKIASYGNESNSVKTFVSSAGIDTIVAGHTNQFYNTIWKVGNKRGGGANSLGYSFEFSNDNGVTYTEKARIDEAGFFLGNAFASPVITGAQVFNANNTNQLFFGNDVIPTVFYQTLGSHVFQVNGNITATINSGGVAVNGALSINGQDVATQSWSTSSFIPSSQKGAANGIATLDTNGLIPTTQLPSYVDDVLEFTNLTSFPTTGESGKIYVALDTNKTYRWSGSSYIYITSGAVDSVNGQTGIVNLSKTDIGLGNIDNTSDLNKPVSTATQTALNGKEGAFSKNTAFNKNFGTTSGTVTEGNHVGSGGTAHANATTSAAGFMSGADKTKLDNIDTSNFVTINTAQTIQEDKDFSSTSDVRFLGNDQNNILVHKSSTGFGGALVSGHDYTHYNTRWRVGNVRGGSTNSTALGFHFSSDNGASFSNRVSINSSDGQINTAIHGNSAEWYNISQNGMYRGNMGLSIYEIYQEIDSINTINLDDPNVQNYNIIYNDANLNGSITIYTLQNSQAFKFTNVSSVGILRIDIDGYGYVDAINPGESRTYVAWGSGKLMRHNPDGTITQMI